WIVWQLLQAAAPENAAIPPEAGAGIPLVERAQSTTGVVTQVTTSLSDEQELGDTLNLPTDMAPAEETVTLTANEEVVLPITPEELELALAAGEEEARTASLENVRAAENDAAALLAANETDTALAEEGEGDADTAGLEAVEEADASDAAEEAVPVLSVADRLNAEALNRLALEEQAPEATPTEDPAEATELASVETGVTDDGIEIVLGDANDTAETVVATPVVDGRTPATIRTAVEPVYPSRCESAADASETVTVRYTVSRYGKVVSPEVTATTNACFNRAALAAISRWDFFPAEENGAAIGDSDRTSRVVFQRP
ncbi:MAG: TonB family protein, partial [Pseudomonadota bacterium]